MSKYLCPNCGCDEFLVARRLYTYYHLEFMDDACGKYLMREEELNLKEEIIESAQCRECDEDIDFDAPKIKTDSAA